MPVYSSDSVAAIIVAGGSGTRFQSTRPKQFQNMGSRWVVEWSIETFLKMTEIKQVIVVVPSDWLEECVSRWKKYGEKISSVIAGGSTRFQSVSNGLSQLHSETKIVLLHDAARPGVTESIIRSVIDGVRKTGASLPVTPVAATVKRVNQNIVTATVPRDELTLAQTPQGFQLELLRSGIQAAGDQANTATDEIQLVESLFPGCVTVVDGSERNAKITTQEDLERMTQWLTSTEYRTGTGYDVHRLVADRTLILGGVRIDSELGLLGHSDADVICHAIADAMLGAIGLGDIGKLFPDHSAEWKDADSLKLLRIVADKLQEAGWSVVNIDCTLLLEHPKVMKFREQMCENIAKAIGVDIDRVSVKATTNEGLGAIGNREGAAAQAIATVKRTL